jgi:hypothetical protein
LMVLNAFKVPVGLSRNFSLLVSAEETMGQTLGQTPGLNL